ncbi:phytanoyl-CoA dioxygenase [Elysia marginata]|uniref:Phytanoyl-CoA dioxygenase n=1 Tax=Elysia marginata TaxID=1093978 RepID=A0AAV4ICU1_9GAST|nr:phytanoyl-CoA dioxygenase [Elysia marginata]
MCVNSLSQGQNVDLPKVGPEPQTSRSENRASITRSRRQRGLREGHNEISHKDSVLAVIEGQRAVNFFKQYFDSEVVTFDYKWLRAMPNAGFTGVHVDNVYMSRGSPDLLTMWTPLGDVDIEMGVLAVCEGSHRLPGFDHFQATYGNMDAEKVGLKGIFLQAFNIR